MKIYTDGSFNFNKKVHGFACYIPELNHQYKFGLRGGTSQQAELKGILYALNFLLRNIIGSQDIDKITIISDSMYSINCLTQWRHPWQNSAVIDQTDGRILRKRNKHIANWELVKCCWKTMEMIEDMGYIINFEHIKSHGKDTNAPKDKIDGNAMVDKLAKEAIMEVI